MEDLCRLCLSISQESLIKFSDNLDIIHKIQSCFSIKIEFNKLLPNQICELCLSKINIAYEFHKKIIESEHLLLEHLKKGNDIKILSFKIKNECNIKQEPEELSESKENTYSVPFETNYVLKREFEETETNTSENVTTIIIEANYEPKQENADNAEPNTSDDELLSKIKQDKTTSENKIEYQTNLVTDTYKCLTCFQILDSQTDLIKHYNVVHSSKKDSDKGDEYTTEMADNKAVYKCNVCSKEYSRKRYILRHLVGHSDLRPFLCKICGRTYKTVSDIVRHGRVHNERKLFCSYQCGYSTVYTGALRAHERRHESSDFKYKCDKCDKGFDVRTWYDQHQNIHNGLKPFVCDICGLAFPLDRYLTAHRSGVHPQSSALKRFVCVHCSLPCDSKRALTKHLVTHGFRSCSLCDLCGKTFSTAVKLKFHKRMHLGEKSYKCSTCNKSFTKKSNLAVHLRTHTGERAHACVHCARRYTQRSTLLRHYAKQHPGTEPMDCVKCEKSFPSMSKQQLKIHQRNCNGK